MGSVKLRFVGAAQEVTGSKHLLSVDGEDFLLDCGLFQGRREESYRRNTTFPFSPSQIRAVILSHAHIDHSGNIPQLVRMGFGGSVYATHGTSTLLSLMLRDAAHVQKSELEYVNKLRARKGLPPAKPLYDLDDVEEAIRRTIGIHLHREVFISEKVSITFLNAGHLLGAALTVVKVKVGGGELKIGYTGDLGRKGMPLLDDPEQLTDIDYLICESTYGNRTHPPLSEAKALLEKVINEAWKEGGKIIVPAFSVERTQDLLYTLYQLQEEERIPELKIFIDSPLSVNATEVFFSHPEFLREEVKEMIYRGEDPFHLRNVEFVRSVERSKQLNRMEGPALILSASGMCEAGRILHHLHNNIEDPRTRILIVGFMARNTLGRKLADGAKEVRIFGEIHTVRAKVHVFHNFSSHADADQLYSFVMKVKKSGRLKKVFLTHGEPDQSLPLKKRLEEAGLEVYYPDEGEEFVLG